MRILHQRGVHLPQQLSIVGFDDVNLLARYLYPALTTMQYRSNKWRVVLRNWRYSYTRHYAAAQQQSF